jgi:hypothetical protein
VGHSAGGVCVLTLIFRAFMIVEVHIIGTGHHYQFGAGATFGSSSCSHEDAVAFQSFLISSAGAVNATAICEELSREALKAVDATVSVPETVAANLGLPHLFCDPDRAERRTLGIMDDNQVRVQAEFFERPKPTEAEIQERILQHYQLRESEWHRRIIDSGNTKILFICGSNHVDSFLALLQSNGIRGSLLCTDWIA